MAGDSSRFRSLSDRPKYLIDVLGKPMLAYGVEGCPFVPEEIIAIVRKDHYEQFDAVARVRDILGERVQVIVVGPTRGAIETVLLGLKQAFVSPMEPICIKDADCLSVPSPGWRDKVETESQRGDRIWLGTHRDNLLMEERETNKSHVRFGEAGEIVEVAEKIRLSPYFIAGHYVFSSGSFFEKEAKEFVRLWEERRKGELYLSGLVSHVLKQGGSVANLSIEKYADLGTPEALKNYESHHRI